VLDALDAVAMELGSNPGRVALAWIAARGIVPVLGPKSVAQLEDNLAATDLRLSAEQFDRLDAVSTTPAGIPHELLRKETTRRRLAGGKPELIDRRDDCVR
jgi:aryl-alcohol dehydrogenase-like predicted oxidoreductase